MNFNKEEFKKQVAALFYKNLSGNASSYRVDGDKLENVLDNFADIFEAIADGSVPCLPNCPVSFDPIEK
jgi:signal transduction histidine kinase